MATITGTKFSDTLSGTTGADNLTGLAGNDLLIGLEGNDTYSFSPGSGNDTIALSYQNNVDTIKLSSIDLKNISFSAFDQNLLIHLTPQDSVLVEGWFSGSESYIGNIKTSKDYRVIAWGNGGDALIVGTGKSEILLTFDGNDTLKGWPGGDYIFAGGGNDLIIYNSTYAGVQGGSGVDTISAYDEQKNIKLNLNQYSDIEVFVSGVGNDSLIGNSCDNVLIGGSGRDTLSGGKGADRLSGNEGADVYLYNFGDGNDTIAGDTDNQNDTVVLSREYTVSNLVLTRGDNNLVIAKEGSTETLTLEDQLLEGSGLGALKVGGVAYTLYTPAEDTEDSLSGSAKTDWILTGSADDWINGQGGADVIQAGAGNDTIQYDSADKLVDGGDGFDLLDASSLKTAQTIQLGNSKFRQIEGVIGSQSNDKLTGDSGNNYLAGGSGKDTLSGGSGADTLAGGQGADVYLYNFGDGNDTIAGDTDNQNDTAVLSREYTVNNLVLTRSGNNLVIAKDGSTETLTLEDQLLEGYGLGGLKVGGVAYTLYTPAEDTDTSLSGSAKTEWILAGSADDWIDGQGGADVIQAGAGNDTIQYDSADKLVDGGDGFDLLDESNLKSAQTIQLGNSKFRQIEGVIGSQSNDKLTGDSGNNYLAGGSGKDTLSGGSGADTLAGGQGADVYIYNLGDGQDVIVADNDNANDSLAFGAGIQLSDLVFRQDGDDLIINVGKSETDSITIQDGLAEEPGKRINQVIVGGKRYTIAVGDDDANQVLGSKASDLLYGLGGDDTLNGLGGADNLFGGAGNDVLVYDAADARIDGGAGLDTLSASSATGGVTINLASKIFSEIEVVIGSRYSDRLSGSSGDETLIGGAGADTLSGGGGNDVFLYAEQSFGRDVITDFDKDNDELRLAWVDANEDGVSITISGKNVILSQSGNSIMLKNVIDSGHSDISNIYFGDKKVRLNWNGSSYTWSSDTTVLSGTSENDWWEGQSGDEHYDGLAGDDYIDGKAGNDTLYGGAGNDRLINGAGDDYMVGGLGNDTYYVEGQYTSAVIDSYVGEGNDNGYDVVMDTWNLGSCNFSIEGNDLIVKDLRFSNWFLGSDYQVDEVNFGITKLTADQLTDAALGRGVMISGREAADLYLDGASGNDTIYGLGGNDIIRGCGGSDLLYGNDGADTIEGGAGNDTLLGGSGNDYLMGEAGNDVYLYSIGDNHDTIASSVDNGNDIVIFDPALSIADVQIQSDGNDVRLIINANDSLTLENWNFGNAYSLNQFVFGNYTYSIGSDFTWKLVNEGHTYGTSENDWWEGQSGDEYYDGLAGDDYIDGKAGNDTLYGGAGNDRLINGAGDDYMVGGLGNDTYYVEGQYTSAVIDSYVGEGNDNGYDVVMDTWNLGSCNFSIEGNDLIVKDLRFSNWFLGSDYQVDEVNFGITKLTADQLTDAALGRGVMISGREAADLYLDGASGNDTIYGLGGNDIIRGCGGNDLLYGNDGADTIDGGAGNDTLVGGSGDDMFVFQSGWGNDLIVPDEAGTADIIDFSAMGLASKDITVSIGEYWSGGSNDLSLTYGGNTLIVGSAGNDEAYCPTFKFTDGAKLWKGTWI